MKFRVTKKSAIDVDLDGANNTRTRGPFPSQPGRNDSSRATARDPAGTSTSSTSQSVRGVSSNRSRWGAAVQSEGTSIRVRESSGFSRNRS